MGHCAFVRRSDRSFTYGLCRGRGTGDELSFRVDERGRCKTLAREQCAANVKVPALARVLWDHRRSVAAYLAAKARSREPVNALEKCCLDIVTSLNKDEEVRGTPELQQPTCQDPNSAEGTNCAKQPQGLLTKEKRGAQQEAHQAPTQKETKSGVGQPRHDSVPETQTEEDVEQPEHKAPRRGTRRASDPPGAREPGVPGMPHQIARAAATLPKDWWRGSGATPSADRAPREGRPQAAAARTRGRARQRLPSSRATADALTPAMAR